MSTSVKIDTLGHLLGAIANSLGGHITADDYRKSIAEKGPQVDYESVYVTAVDELELARAAYTAGNTKDAEHHVEIAIEKFREVFSSLDGLCKGYVIEHCEDKNCLNLGKFSDLMGKIGLTISK